jgi:hypothetical protein
MNGQYNRPKESSTCNITSHFWQIIRTQMKDRAKSVISNDVPPSSAFLDSMSSKHLFNFLLTPAENFAKVKANRI